MQKQSDNASEVAILSLAKLVQLLSAELVAGSHRDDVSRLEQAIRAKTGQFDTSAFTAEATEEGLQHARLLIEKVLVQVRAQAEEAAKSKLVVSQTIDSLPLTRH